MAEEEEKKEEQGGISRTGEVEWISLEQAGVLAMRTAREAPGNYGRSFAGIRMVFDVTEQEDGEDFYIITLSLRPEGDFVGTPGQEQFFIEKEGSVAHRQVRSLPGRQGGGRRFPWIPVGVISLVVAIAAAAVVLFATGVLPPETVDPTPIPERIEQPQFTVGLIPDQPARLDSPAGDVTIDLSTGSVDQPMELVYQELSSAQIPALPDGFSASEKLFDLSVTGAQATAASLFSLAKPATITVRLNSEDIRRADQVESNLVIQHFGVIQQKWTELATTVDFNAATASALADSFSIFALTIREPIPTDPPTPVAESFQLTVNGIPVTGASVATANATVSVSPPPNAPNNQYITGTEVNVTLLPASGFTGSCGPLAVTMTSDRNVSCTMTQQNHVLTIQGVQVREGQTTVEVANGEIDLSEAPGSDGRYASNVQVELTAVPDSEGAKIFWDGVDKGELELASIQMDRDRFVTVDFVTEDDHGNSIDTATFIPDISEGFTPGIINPADDPDFFGFFASAGAIYIIEVLPDTHPDTVLTLFDSKGQWLDEDDDSGQDGSSRLEWTAPSAGKYFVKVFSFDQSVNTGSYFLSLSVEDDHGDCDNATFISEGFISGTINPSHDLDCFSVSTQPGTTYTIEVFLDTHPDTVLTLFDSRGNRLAEDDGGGRGVGELLEWSPSFTGDYYVEVRSFDQSFSTGSYTLLLTLSLSAEDDHGDSIETATFITEDFTFGTINPPSDPDFFGFYAEAGTTYTIEAILDTHPDTVLALFDSRGTLLEENDQGAGMEGGSRLEWTAPASGDYYLKVFSYFSEIDTGSYSLSLGVEDDHGDCDNATFASEGFISGTINPAHDLDCFSFFASAGATYTIEVLRDTHPDTVFRLYDSELNWLAEDDDSGPEGGEFLEWTAPLTGDYYIEVRSYDQSFQTGSYFLSLSVDDDHGDSIDTATLVSEGFTSGAIDTPNDLDFFGFSARAGATYIIEVLLDTHPDSKLILFDSKGNQVAEDDDGGQNGGSLLVWTAPSTSEYYVKVYSYDQSFQTGSYTLLLEGTGPQDTLFDGKAPRDFVIDFLSGAIDAEILSLYYLDASYSASYYSGQTLRDFEASVADLSAAGYYKVATFDYGAWQLPDVRVVDSSLIEVDSCEWWTESLYQASTGALLESGSPLLYPQTLTLEHLATGWYVTAFEFYNPPHFCSG